MSLSLSRARATIKKVTVDKKTEDDGTKTATAALKIEVKTSADILAEFHPSLRAAMFVGSGAVRFAAMKEVGWEGTRRGVDIGVRPGPDMEPAIKLGDVTLRDFKLKPIEESGQQLVFMRFMVDLNGGVPPPVTRLVDYLKEECWIDIQGGGELDLGPPSAGVRIPELGDESAPPASAAPATAPVTDATVNAVRRLQPTTKGVQTKLRSYANEVLTAAIAAETAASTSRPMFISMLEAELKRRLADDPTKGNA